MVSLTEAFPLNEASHHPVLETPPPEDPARVRVLLAKVREKRGERDAFC